MLALCKRVSDCESIMFYGDDSLVQDAEME